MTIEYTDKITLTNNSKKSKTIVFQVLEPAPLGDSLFILTSTPKKGEVKKNEKVEIEFKLKVFSRKSEIKQQFCIIIQYKKELLKKEEKPGALPLKFCIPAEESGPTTPTPKKQPPPTIQKVPSTVTPSKDTISNSGSYPIMDDKDPYGLAPKLEITPQENLAALGWMNEIPRLEAVNLLANKPLGTFLLRFSRHSHSYVLSYVKENSEVHHIAQIVRRPQPTNKTSVRVTEVDKAGNRSVRDYDSLIAFIDEMKNHGFLTHPVEIYEKYALSPAANGQQKPDNYAKKKNE